MKGGSTMIPGSVEAVARASSRFAFSFGRRFFLLLFMGLVWLVPAFVDRRFAYAMLGWDLLLVVALVADVLALPRPGKLRLRRNWSSPLELSVEAAVEIVVENQSQTFLRIHGLDYVPPALRTSPASFDVTAPARSEASARYKVRPGKRGESRLSACYLRYQSALRLAERWATADLAQDVTVYPDLGEARRHAMFLVRGRQVELEKRLSRVRGAGRSFESLREYRDGDDFSDICWTATARRGKLVTRLYELEKSQTVWVVLDTGRLMRTRVASLSKLDHAVNAALALSQVALMTGDRVGLLAYTRTIQSRVPPERGKTQLRQLLEALASVREDGAEADHLQAVSRLMRDQKRRSFVVWITDLAETAMTPEVIEAASALVSRHFVLFVVIGQPDLRRAAAQRPTGLAQMYEVAAVQEVMQRREVLLARLRERGALAVEVESGGLAPLLVNSYLEVKQRNQL
jgi:uncharacterized protein (DUF58 family)